MSKLRRLQTALVCAVLMAACGIRVRVPRPTPPTPPPVVVATEFNVACVISDLDSHQPVEGARCQDGDVVGVTNGDGYFLLQGLPAGKREMFVSKDGYVSTGVIYDNDRNKDLHIQIHRVAPVWPQPESLTPLVLEPSGPKPDDICHHEQIVSTPDSPDKRFWLGDAWGVTIPDLPFVSGGSSRHPERLLTWFYDRYDASNRQKGLEGYRRHGYTHWLLSWPDSRDGNGQSIPEFVGSALEVHRAIPFVAVALTSKVYDFPHNLDGATQLQRVAPVVDALLAAGFDENSLILVVGWELDTFNEGQRLEDFSALLMARYPKLDIYWHFTSYKTSWQPDGQPRAQFWQFLASRRQQGAIGLLYQGNQNDTCGQMQAHFNDAQRPASGLQAAGAILVPWELVASNEFDGDHPNENDANARGWSVMNTPGPLLASGFGNGGRHPDGRPILVRYAQ